MKRLARSHTNRLTSVSSPLSGRYLILLVFAVFGLLFQTVAVTASTLSEEFVSSGEFLKGSIVSIAQNNPNDIQLSTVSNGEYLLGVVTNSGESLVTYAKNDSDVLVSLTGEVQVFVNNANGPILKGDFIGASWLEGVGMKAISTNKQKLLGIALDDFTDNDGSDYGLIETSNGEKDIRVGTISVRLFDKEGAQEVAASESGVEGILADIAGKSVSFTKVIVSLIIFIMSIIVAGFFVGSSIKGSFISIGRNPMASASIYRSLLHVTMVAVVIILIGTALTYVVLVV